MPSVLIVRGKITRLLKIEKTADVKKRLRALQVNSPDELELVASISVPAKKECSILKAVLHRQFFGSRSRTKWFALNNAQETFLQEIVRQPENERAEFLHEIVRKANVEFLCPEKRPEDSKKLNRPYKERGRPKGSFSKHSLQLKTKTLALFAQGTTFAEIGRILGFSKQRAHQIVKEAEAVSESGFQNPNG